MTPWRRRLGFLLLPLLVAAAFASDDPVVEISIVHTNDVHGHVDTAAAAAAVAREERTRNPNTLFLDAGDCVSGTPLSTLYQGRPIFDIMTLMGYDAVALGNHEFDYGWQRIPEYREIAAFPLLCANADDPEGKPLGDAPYRVFELDGVRIGVIGLITEDVPTLTTAKASKGCTFEPPLDAAKRLVPEVRKECDAVVLLTHVGVEVDVAIAGALKGVDLIVGGHTHTELEQPLIADGVPVVQAKSYGRRVGIVRMQWDREAKRFTGVKGHLVKLDADAMPNAPDVKKLVDEWEASIEEKVGAVIGRAAKRMGKKALRAAIERIYKAALDTDFGYQNMGGIRANIEEGDITIRDIWTVLPFDNTMVRLRLKGEQVPKYARDRLGKRFDPGKEYVFATNSYVGDQREKYFKAPDAPVEDTGLMMRDLVVEWVREHGGFEPAK